MVNQGNNACPESDFVDLDDTNEGIKKEILCQQWFFLFFAKLLMVINVQ